MDLKIFLEWDEETALSLSKLYPLQEGLEEHFKLRNYGDSIASLWIILICRRWDFKQRKRYKKSSNRLEYDILLDFFLIKHSDVDEKKRIIKKQMIETSTQIFSKYKFNDFDSTAFLNEFENKIQEIEW